MKICGAHATRSSATDEECVRRGMDAQVSLHNNCFSTSDCDTSSTMLDMTMGVKAVKGNGNDQ